MALNGRRRTSKHPGEDVEDVEDVWSLFCVGWVCFSLCSLAIKC